MKTTLFLKATDLVLQILFFTFPIVTSIVTAEFGYIMIGYLLVGGAQLLSTLLNSIFLNSFYRHSGRRIYYWGLVFASVFAAMLSVAGFNYQMLVICFFIACGLMAIGYLFISFAETKYIYRLIEREQYTRI